MPITNNLSPCPADCIYLGTCGGWSCCDYWLIEDKLHGCEGGANCEKYISETDPKVQSGIFGKRQNKKFDKATANILFTLGFSDYMIAEGVGVSRGTIVRWRKNNGIERNGRPTKTRRKEYRINTETAKRLYERGYSDAEIGRQMSISPKTIFAWRKRNGLPSKWEAR